MKIYAYIAKKETLFFYADKSFLYVVAVDGRQRYRETAFLPAIEFLAVPNKMAAPIGSHRSYVSFLLISLYIRFYMCIAQKKKRKHYIILLLKRNRPQKFVSVCSLITQYSTRRSSSNMSCV